MISLALQGEIFTSYFFGLIFAISLSLKITVIFRYVCCLFQVVSLEEHKMTWLEKMWAPHSPGSEGRQMPSPVGDIVSLLSRWPRWLFCTQSFLIHSPCFLLRLGCSFQKLTGRKAGVRKTSFLLSDFPQTRTTSVGLFGPSVDSGPDAVWKRLGLDKRTKWGVRV